MARDKMKNNDSYCRKEEQIGLNIRRYLQLNEITQASFAKASGIGISKLNQIINGKYSYSKNDIFKIAETMQISAEELSSENFLQDEVLSEENLRVIVSNIKRYVKVNNLTQKEFVRKVGVNDVTLWNKLHSQVPGKAFLAKIADAMNASDKELLDEEFLKEEAEEQEKNLEFLIESITKYCETNNMTQEKFAEKVGVSRYTIHKIVYGKGKPSKETAEKIKKVTI